MGHGWGMDGREGGGGVAAFYSLASRVIVAVWTAGKTRVINTFLCIILMVICCDKIYNVIETL